MDTSNLDEEIDKLICLACRKIGMARHIKVLILSEAHRIGNLAIGEDEGELLPHGDGIFTEISHDTVARNDLRKEQRQKLSTLTGVKENE